MFLDAEEAFANVLIEKDTSGNFYYDALVDRQNAETALNRSSAVSASKLVPDHNSEVLDSADIEEVTAIVNDIADGDDDGQAFNESDQTPHMRLNYTPAD